MSNLYRRLAIDASYQVSVYWPSGSRGEDLKRSAIHKQELPVVPMFANGSRKNEQSL